MANIKRVLVIVLDGVGVGAAPDADAYGDVGSNSVGNTARELGGIDLPNMGAIGLGNITPVEGVPPRTDTTGAYGKCTPTSAGKDSISGHWTLAGITLEKPFPTYPDGFPPEIMDEFEKQVGRGTLGNKPMSGTAIIQELGEEHMHTGKLIVYTSADSVFQIAAHEEIVPIEEQYRICKLARDILVEPHNVGRVIARPFVGNNAEDFSRTGNRKDFPCLPAEDTVLDKLVAEGYEMHSVGKIDDLFGHRGMTHKNHTKDNASGIQGIYDDLKKDFEGMIFVNLIEYDMLFGHRNDYEGYAAALKQFDDAIPEIRELMKETDIAMVVADHGVDPTTPSTDHSREYIPLLVFGEQVKSVNLGTRETYSDVAATICEIFNLKPPTYGTSFLKDIINT